MLRITASYNTVIDIALGSEMSEEISTFDVPSASTISIPNYRQRMLCPLSSKFGIIWVMSARGYLQYVNTSRRNRTGSAHSFMKGPSVPVIHASVIQLVFDRK